jgi:hypothetical protein
MKSNFFCINEDMNLPFKSMNASWCSSSHSKHSSFLRKLKTPLNELLVKVHKIQKDLTPLAMIGFCHILWPQIFLG